MGQVHGRVREVLEMSNYCESAGCNGKPVHKVGNCSRAAKVARQQASQRRSAKRATTVDDAQHARCGSCQGIARVAFKDGAPLGFERHKVPGSPDWCRNGTQPVAKGKGSHRGKSVRAVSGGLPTLGRG